ncbi:MAG: SDR family NAD(P)-dependent oxidoreductase [Pseudomonadaceae bacterium]
MLRLSSFGSDYRALVIGNSGALGQAFCQNLRSDPACSLVSELGRGTEVPIDLENPGSIVSAAASLRNQAPYHLILLATGLLHRADAAPEKSLSAIDPNALQVVFQVNALGPAIVLREFLPLLDRQGAMAVMSARVGSIGDNRLGGWYAYRASKAALNMLVKTAAIELARKSPKARLLSLHPGTVQSDLSKPFRSAAAARPAAQAAEELLGVIDRSLPSDSGGFFAYDGKRVEW